MRASLKIAAATWAPSLNIIIIIIIIVAGYSADSAVKPGRQNTENPVPRSFFAPKPYGSPNPLVICKTNLLQKKKMLFTGLGRSVWEKLCPWY